LNFVLVSSLVESVVEQRKYVSDLSRTVGHHADVIFKNLSARNPKFLLHEHLWEDVLKATSEHVKTAPGFELLNAPEGSTKTRTLGFKILGRSKDGSVRRHFFGYELGNEIIVRRLASQLTAEGVLPKGVVPAFRRFMARAYHNPPSIVKVESRKGFQEIVDRLGSATTGLGDAEKLFQRAGEVNNESLLKLRAAFNRLTAVPHLVVPDFFLNPHNSNNVSNWFSQAREKLGKSWVAYLNEKL